MRLLLFLVATAMAHGAGTVTQTLTKLGDTDNYEIAVTWTADASNGSVPATALVTGGSTLASTRGFSIISVITDPGSPAPTDNYDLTFIDGNGLDILNSECLNRSTSATQSCSADPNPISGTVTVTLANNSVNSATGVIKVKLVKLTTAKRGGGGGADILAGDGITTTGTTTVTVSTDSATVPEFSTGAGQPSANCTAGREFYLDTTNTRFFRCSAANTWMEVSRSSSGSGAPSSGACDAAAEVGGLYYRTDNTSGAAGHYGCAQTGSGTFGWVLLGGSSAGTYVVMDGNGGGATVPASARNYIGPGVGSVNATENARQTIAPVATTATGIYVRITTTQNAGGTLVCTLRVNGVDQSDIQVTFANADGSPVTKSDTGSVAIVAGDLISVGCLNNYSGGASATLNAFSVYGTR